MILKICHLYGNLMNTYGDNGNLLMLQYLAKEKGNDIETTLVSLEEPFDPNQYDLVFFGGGQDYEQKIVAKDLKQKASALRDYIEQDGVMVAICGGYQLLGDHYTTTKGETFAGIQAIDYYSDSQSERLVGDLTTYNERFNLTLEGYENHAGRTYLGSGVEPLGKVLAGYGNNGQDQSEGAMYHNTFCSYFHGPLLVRNPKLGAKIIDLAMENHQGKR
ncbi:MAG: adenosylcobyric acid synthase [Aerococcus sp.]|nr:adenosylcobyric acid synthase [Aerococcus sp.]